MSSYCCHLTLSAMATLALLAAPVNGSEGRGLCAAGMTSSRVALQALFLERSLMNTLTWSYAYMK